MKLLVDTQVFLWYATADPHLPVAMRSVMRSPDNELWLSAVSAWEIAVKNRAGKLPLPMQPSDFILEARRRLAFQPLPLEERAVAHLPKLPNLHKDPFDRMLMCQSIEHGMVMRPAMRSFERIRFARCGWKAKDQPRNSDGALTPQSTCVDVTISPSDLTLCRFRLIQRAAGMTTQVN